MANKKNSKKEGKCMSGWEGIPKKKGKPVEKCTICGRLFPPKGHLIINPNKEKKYCVCFTLAPGTELLDN
jgi:hypothetical protein